MPALPLLFVRHPVEPDDLQIHIEVGIGRETIRVMLDTGADDLVLPYTGETSRLPAITGGDTRPGYGATGVPISNDQVLVPRLALGSLTLVNVAAERTSVDSLQTPLLGMDVLGRYRCHFRFTLGRLDIGGKPQSLPAMLPLELMRSSRPMVPVTFGDLNVTAVWDTGASLSVLDAAFANDHPELIEITGNTYGSDASGVTFNAPVGRLDRCTIGGVDFEPSTCVVIDLGPINAMLDQPIHMALGTPIMTQADWLFDFPDRTWAITQLPSF